MKLGMLSKLKSNFSKYIHFVHFSVDLLVSFLIVSGTYVWKLALKVGNYTHFFPQSFSSDFAHNIFGIHSLFLMFKFMTWGFGFMVRKVFHILALKGIFFLYLYGFIFL